MLVASCGSQQTAATEAGLFAPPPAELPLVSVVVACYGQLEHTKALVASLEQNAGTRYELILIDNGCPEGTAEWARRNSIRVHQFHVNQGVPVAYNEGVRLASGGIIALFNNDMVVHPGGLKRLAEATYYRGLAAQTGGVFSQAGDYLTCTADAAWADYAEGYALAFRRDVWEKVGVWDTSFFPSYSDDADWVLRARLAGYDFVLVPGCVTHFGQATSGRMNLSATVRRHAEIIRDRYLAHGLGQRICVLRWGASGDLIMATPALRALKAELPLARLHVHCEPGCGMVLAGLPYVDRRCSGPFNPQDYSRVVDLRGAYEWGQRRGEFVHPVDAYCTRAGVRFDGQPYDFRIPPHLRDWAAEKLGEAGRLIACGLRSGTRAKQNWRASGWLELAEALPKGTRLVALDSATRPALGRADAVEDGFFYAHPRVLDLTGQTPTLHHAAALMDRCEGFVGVDSGLLHVAAALEKPIVNLCAAAPRASRLPLVGDAHGFEGIGDCFPCQYRDPCPEAHCLDWFTGKMVWGKLRGMLK